MENKLKPCPFCGGKNKLALKAGEKMAVVLELLMDMVDQFFTRRTYNPNDEDYKYLEHSFMNAEENSIEFLLELGLADKVEGKGYFLRYDKLEKLKKGG